MEDPTSSLRIDLLALLERTVSRHAAQVALASEREQITYRELGQSTRRLAERLVQSGVRPGDRIAIFGRPGPSWSQVFFGVLNSGAIVVPLDARLEAEDLRAVLEDCSPRRVFAGAELAEKVESALVGASVEQVHPFDWGDWPADRIPRRSREECDLPRERGLHDDAVLAYTSGSTGRPKGVRLGIGNLLYQAERLTEVMDTSPEDNFVSILPPNHLLELTGGLLGPLFAGARIDHASPLAPQEVIDLMRERRATVLIGVPLFFHALGRLLEMAASKGIPPARALGGRVRMFISGGAPLERTVLDYFWRAGLPLLEGYGLTETSPVVTLNRLEAHRPGSVGRPLPGVELRIAASSDGAGEILTRGPHVMQGYWNSTEQSAEVLDADGWLHTGDLGHLDVDGYLWITGRVKELIVLGSGKKVQPAEVEAALGAQIELAEVCVVADVRRGQLLAGSERVCAVVVPAPELAASLRGEPDGLQHAVEDLVAAGARALADYKRPKRVVLHPGPLPRTPTGKLRRAQLAEWVRNKEEKP